MLQEMDADEYIIRLLRNNKLKVTPQRITILKLLINGGHFSIDQILNEARKIEPSISISTIYTTLNAFVNAGLVRSFELDGKTWYEIRKEPHVNVLCKDSGEIIDVNGVDIAWIENELRKAGIWIDDLIVIARGNCEEYLNKSKSK
ncbi:MAG: Fur family transcriptional regulator [Vulcanisaeta sp.]|jgi:Fe2+ or Zn2+ uptake regulation protein